MKPPEIVVITGASAGVGRATARVFGGRRAKVGLIARGREGLEAAKREIAHGVFDDRSVNVSIEMELNKRRGWILAGPAMLLLAVITRRGCPKQTECQEQRL